MSVHSAKCFLLTFLACLLLTNKVRGEDPTPPALNECVYKAGFSDLEEIPPAVSNRDKRVECLIGCLLKKLRLLGNGKLMQDAIITMVDSYVPYIPNELTKRRFLECFDESTANMGEADDCDVRAIFVDCLDRKNNSIG